MLLTPAQGLVVDDRHRFRVLCSGRRFGKTTLAVEEIKGRALFTKANIAYIATTYAQARDIAWETLKKELRGCITSINESRLEIKINNQAGEESVISLRGWESIETLRGLSFDMIVIDEVASMRNFWSSWQEVVRPTLTDRKGEVMFISTPAGYNHFYELFNMELTDNDYKSFHFTSYDNPHLDPIEIDKARAEITETRFAQEYLADFKKVEGLVYKEFDRSRHLYETLPPDVHYDFLGGVDFGFTHPCAVTHVKRDTNGVYWVDNEWYQKGRTESQVADYILSCKFNKVYPDPENPSAIQTLSSKGVNVREVIKNKDSVKNGIDKVRDLFKQNKLKINKRCVNLIAELESYSYGDSKDGGDQSENPIKEFDDLCFTKDTKIEVPIGSIITQVYTGKRDIYEFMGSRVTANHPYLTQRGFVRLDSLRYSDSIVVWKNKLLMELFLDGTQNQRSVRIGTIFSLLLRNLSAIKQNVFTGIYGKSITVSYLKAFIFTTKMAIQLITTYLISKLYHLWNITTDIMRKIFRCGRRLERESLSKLASGQEHQKVKGLEDNGGKEMQNTFHDQESKDVAINAEKNILPRQPLESSATIIAELKHCGQEDVYSTATTSGFFTANGVVVSNCDSLRYVIYMESAMRKKIVESKPRPVLSDSRYEGNIKTYQDDDEITEEQLARM